MAGTIDNPIDLTWHVTDLIDLAKQADMAWRCGGGGWSCFARERRTLRYLVMEILRKRVRWSAWAQRPGRG